MVETSISIEDINNLLNSYNKSVALAVEDFDLYTILNHGCPDCKETYVVGAFVDLYKDNYTFTIKCRCKSVYCDVFLLTLYQNKFSYTTTIQQTIENLLERIRNT